MREGDTFSRRRQETDVLDRFLSITKLLLIADDYAITRFALQQLRYRIAADGCSDRILYVRSIDTEACGRLAIDYKVKVGLAHIPEEPKVLNSRHSRHHGSNLLALFLQGF